MIQKAINQLCLQSKYANKTPNPNIAINLFGQIQIYFHHLFNKYQQIYTKNLSLIAFVKEDKIYLQQLQSQKQTLQQYFSSQSLRVFVAFLQQLMTSKLKCSLVFLIIFFCGASVLLYFTITECFEECIKDDQYSTPCSYQGESFCCSVPIQNLPTHCQKCILKNAYCYQYMIGAAACLLVTVILILYICCLTKNKEKQKRWDDSQNLTIQTQKSVLSEYLNGGTLGSRPFIPQNHKFK